MDEEQINALVGRIYDCAVDPELWVDTLNEMCGHLETAFVSVAFFDFNPTYPENARPRVQAFVSDWDPEWYANVAANLDLIPGLQEMRDAEIDEPHCQLDLIDESAFRKTEFFQQFVGPKGMLDNISTNIIRRPGKVARLSAGALENRRPFNDKDRDLIRLLSPHIRRAMLISDIIEEKSEWLRMYREMLDDVTVPVALVDRGGSVKYHNQAAEALLVDGRAITLQSGRLVPRSAALVRPFLAAVERACVSRDIDIGLWGAGVSLSTGSNDLDGLAVAYVLPLGQSDVRRQLGPGHAAVFFSTSLTQRPPSFEVISAITGLTTSESRIALSVASGQGTAVIAADLGISIQTLRKHLANIYDKSGLRSQTALASFINSLSEPVSTRNESRAMTKYPRN